MSLEFKIALTCLVGLRLGYLIVRYDQYDVYSSPGLSWFLGFVSLVGLIATVLGSMAKDMTYEQQISGDTDVTGYLWFIFLPLVFWAIGMLLAICTQWRWAHPTLEARPLIWLKRATRRQHRRVVLILGALTMIAWTFPESSHKALSICLACMSVYVLIAYSSLIIKKVTSPEGQNGDAALTYN